MKLTSEEIFKLIRQSLLKKEDNWEYVEYDTFFYITNKRIDIEITIYDTLKMYVSNSKDTFDIELSYPQYLSLHYLIIKKTTSEIERIKLSNNLNTLFNETN